MYQIICLNPINSLSELQTHSIILGLRLLGPFLGIILKIYCAFLFPLLFIGSLLNFANVFSLVMNSYFSLTSLNKYSHMLLSFFCSLLLRFFSYINSLYCSEPIDLEIKTPIKVILLISLLIFRGTLLPSVIEVVKDFFPPSVVPASVIQNFTGSSRA